MHDAEILVPLTLFASVGVIAWKFFEGRHQERMAMIEKGIAPDTFFKKRRDTRDPLPVLKWGLLGLFTGVGMFGGICLVEMVHLPNEIVLAIALLSAGLGLVIYYMIAARRYRDEVHVEL